MKKKNIIILSFIMVLALVGSAYMLSSNKNAVEVKTAQSIMFSELNDAANSISAIHVTSPQDKVIISNTEKGWFIENRHGWPADKEKVSTFLNGLVLANKIEKKTVNPALYDRIGVDESSSLITVKAGDTDIASFYLGNNSQELGGTYLREREDKQSWFVSGIIEAGAKSGDWIEAELFSFSKDRVQSLEVKHEQSSESLMLSRADQSSPSFTLNALPEGRSIKSQQDLDDIISALEGFAAEDVTKEDEIDFSKGKLVTAVMKSFDGVGLSISLTRFDKTNWAKLSWSVDETNEQISEELKAEVSALSAKTDGWVFALSSSTYDFLTSKIEDVLKEPETE